MKNRKKTRRIVALLLCMVMIVSSISIFVANESASMDANILEGSNSAAVEESTTPTEDAQSQTPATQSETPAATEPAQEVAPETPAVQEVAPAAEAQPVYQEAMQLKHEFTDVQGAVVATIIADIPEGTFQAASSEVTMDVTEVDANTDAFIKTLMEKNIPEDKILGDYFLYNINFLVNGQITEPGREIKITFQRQNYLIGDAKKANTFYYNAANSVAGNTEAEIVEVTQKADLIEYFQSQGTSTDNIDDYDLSEVYLNADGTANQIQIEGRRSTVYGCYLEEVKPVKTLTYENDDVTLTVEADADDIIPAGTKLQVVPIIPEDKDTKAQFNDVKEQLEKKAAEEEYDIAGFLAYDISLINKDGEEIEPSSEVKVTIDYKQEAIPETVESSEDADLDVTVMHLEENASGEVKDVVDMVADETKTAVVETTENIEVKKAEFTTSSFSAYVITWTSNLQTAKVNITYVDETGTEIGDNSSIDVTGATTANTELDLSTYRTRDKLPTGYQFLKYTKDSYNGTEINGKLKYVEIEPTYFWETTTRKIQYQEKNASEWKDLASLNYGDRSQANIYIVCKVADDNISIADDLMGTGHLVATPSAEFLEGHADDTIKYVWYKSINGGEATAVERRKVSGNDYNVAEDGSWLDVYLDDGILSESQTSVVYTVKAYIADSTEATAESEGYSVTYYKQLRNGSFETPAYGGATNQVTNEQYKAAGGVWQSTGSGRNGSGNLVDIEIVNKNHDLGAYSWYGTKAAADGNQFAELNCEAQGALYQDVLTARDVSLNYWLSHRARGNNADATPENDSMYVVIMPTSIATVDGGIDTQAKLNAYLNANYRVNIGNSDTTPGELVNDTTNGVYVYRYTSDDQSWHAYTNAAYTAKSSLTRFFFVAGQTASNNLTVGNFLDRVGFSQELPPVEDEEYSLEIVKKFEGLDNEALTSVQDNIKFEITAKDARGNALTDEQLTELFGKTTITKEDMKQQPDGSLEYTLLNHDIGSSARYTVTITEVDAGYGSYEMTTTSKTTVTIDSAEPVETQGTTTVATISNLQEKTTAVVEFNNSYESTKLKNVNFTKVWDDKDNEFTTRPESLDVTLKASITVEENGATVEKQLDELTKQATLNAAGSWKTTWEDVPVYYDYNGVDVKINYTVVEGAINSEYVYESPTQGVAQSGDGSDYESTADLDNVATGSETAPTSLKARFMSLFQSSSASTASVQSSDVSTQSDEAGLGEPGHKKYIEYNANTAEYTLNLDVTGAKGEAKGADILFVIDTSGSMGTNKGGGTDSTYFNLLPSLKTLLTKNNGIIDRIFATEGNVNSVAYVSFTGKSETTTSLWYSSTGKQTIKNSINNLKASGGTNWTYAMQKASELMAKKSSSSNEKVVIFLSDGKPTYTINSNGNETGSGSDTESSYYNDTANVVNNSASLKNGKSTIYSVYLTSGTKSGMKTFSDKVANSYLVDGTSLTTALDSILNKIIPTYQNVVITDTLSDNVVFAETNPTITVIKKTAAGAVTTLNANQYTSSVSGKTVTVNLLNGESLEDGSTYTMSFKVKPSDAANQRFSNGGYTDTGDAGTGTTSAGKDGFYSNVKNSTKVTYTIKGETDADGSALYPMPVVQVTTHELSYEKIWKQPTSVTAPTSDVVIHVVYTDGTSKDITLESSKSYKYTEIVPVTKNISSVTESSNISDYTPSYQITDNGTKAVITNSYSKVTTNKIKVVKEWVGGPETTHTPINVSLYRSANGGTAERYGDVVTLNGQNNWQHTWDNLPQSTGSADNIVNYTYAVREENSPANYSSSIVYDSGSDMTTVTITNTYDENCTDEYYYIANVLQTENVSLEKAWEDNDNALRIRPEYLEVKLNGNSFYLKESDKWTKTVKLLKKVNSSYTANEVLNDDRYEQVDSTVSADGKSFLFVNKLKTKSITVHKAWNDGDLTTRPESISFTLQYRESDSSGNWQTYDTYNMTAENKGTDNEAWTMVINNLPITYDYQIAETNVAAGYNSVVTEADGTYTITNTLKWKAIKTSTPIGDKEAVALENAEFELKSGDTVIATGKSGSDGTIAWTANDGINLDTLNGDYTIHETKAPNGYVISGDWQLSFTNGLLTSTTLEGVEVSKVTDATNGVVITITDDEIYALPSTGGMGIYWYLIGGVLLMMAAALILYRKNVYGEVLKR